MGAKTVKSSLTRGEKKKGTLVTYEYVETKTSDAGGGPRGIDIWVKGERGRTGYDIDPNPHDNKKYNKQQAAFYAELAGALADKHVADEKFPKKLTVSWGGDSWTLDS